MKSQLNLLYTTLVQSDSIHPPEAKREVNPESGVIDERTFESIEVDKLFESTNHAVTRIGQAVVYRSLCNPLASAEMIRARQAAIREIEANPELRRGIEGLIGQARSEESAFYDLLYGTFMGLFGASAHEREIEGFGYETYIRGTRFLTHLVNRARGLPAPVSPYLQALIENLLDLESSRAYSLAQGPAYRTEKGIVTRAEKGLLTPAIRFKPTLFKPVGLTLLVLGLLAVLQFVPFVLEVVSSIAPVFWLFLFPLGLLYIPVVGNFDRDSCIYPLREIFKKSPEVQRALESLGQLDELLSAIGFKESFGHPVTLPEIVDAPQHHLSVRGVRNPILAKANPDYVANDIDLRQTRLSLMTGPNSGGKTAFCKTLTQSQLLAQTGGFIPAEQAELTVADRIFYQVPEISHLSDGEGRFGTELRHTKQIFLTATPHSLVIMDELSEGTTHEEKIEISMDILDGFLRKGNSTLLITHNHELVDRFQKRGVGLAIQVEFSHELPTYRVVEGVSRVSHADRVARKIGFSREDIARYLGESEESGKASSS